MSHFKGVEFDPLLAEAGSNSFTMSPTRWVELTSAIGILTKNGAGGGTYLGHQGQASVLFLMEGMWRISLWAAAWAIAS